MGVEELQGLLEGLKRTLDAYEGQEREARARLEQVVQGRLMQAGAVRGVERAIERLGVQAKRAEESRVDPDDKRMPAGWTDYQAGHEGKQS